MGLLGRHSILDEVREKGALGAVMEKVERARSNLKKR